LAVGNAIGMLSDQALVVGAVDGVVQDASVEADLHLADLTQPPEPDEGFADADSRRRVQALPSTPKRRIGSLWVAQADPHLDCGPGTLTQNGQDAGVLGEEQSALGKEADLSLG
jgi:hypothetical protein